MFYCLRPFTLDTVLSILLMQCQLTFENTVKFWLLVPFFLQMKVREVMSPT